MYHSWHLQLIYYVQQLQNDHFKGAEVYCKIFDLSDFHDFYAIKSLAGALGVKIFVLN